jgi:hypothetical protein
MQRMILGRYVLADDDRKFISPGAGVYGRKGGSFLEQTRGLDSGGQESIPQQQGPHGWTSRGSLGGREVFQVPCPLGGPRTKSSSGNRQEDLGREWSGHLERWREHPGCGNDVLGGRPPLRTYLAAMKHAYCPHVAATREMSGNFTPDEVDARKRGRSEATCTEALLDVGDAPPPREKKGPCWFFFSSGARGDRKIGAPNSQGRGFFPRRCLQVALNLAARWLPSPETKPSQKLELASSRVKLTGRR